MEAYEEAGATVLMASDLLDLGSVRAVCEAVSQPFNLMVSIPGKLFSVAELKAVEVRRISLATSLYRAAIRAMVAAGEEVRDHRTFEFVDTGLPTPRLPSNMDKRMRGYSS